MNIVIIHGTKSNPEENQFHFRINNESIAILSQGRTFSSMRFSRHRSAGKVNIKAFKQIFKKYTHLLQSRDFIGSQLPESLHAPNGDSRPHYSKQISKSQEQNEKRGKK
jgi:hypothetical protein